MKTTAHSPLPDYAALLLRVSLGVMYVMHAWLKYAVFTPVGTVAFFEKIGFMGWMAYPVMLAEVVGGVLLIAGVQVRWVALILIPILGGAAYTHWVNGWVFNAPGGGWEYPVFLIVASLVLALLGNGTFAFTPAVAASPVNRQAA